MVGVGLRDALREVHLRIAGHHALVHAIEGQLLSVGAPEGTLFDTELVAVHTLSVNDVLRAVGAAIRSQLALFAAGGHNIEVALDGEGQIAAQRVPVLILCLGRHRLAPCRHMFLEVDEHALLRRAAEHKRFCGVREREVVPAVHDFVTGPRVELLHGEECIAREQVLHRLGCSLDGCVAPPLGVAVLGLQLPEGAATGEQVVQRKVLLRLHGCSGHYHSSSH